MLKHIVVWKLKENADGKTKKENALIFKEKLEALRGEIEELLFLEVGVVSYENPATSNFDIVLTTEFKNEKDLYIYQEHPKHLEVKAFASRVVETRGCVDYIL